MPLAIRRYGFAAVTAGVLALMGAVVVGKSLLPEPSAPAQAGARAPQAPLVQVTPARMREFADEVQALGTAQAFESVTIAAKVTDTIRAVRFDSGQKVTKGQVLVELANVEQIADLNEAKAQLEANQREFDRVQELAERGFATRAALDAARSARNSAEARVQALSARIEDRTLRAPFAGVLGLRNASVGQLVQPGSAIVTLDDVSRIKLDFDAPESQLALLRPGARLAAETAAFPGQVFEGEIDQIDSRVDPATRTVRARAVLPNSEGALKPGMLMTVRVRANVHEALAVPETAVVEQAEGAFVYRVAGTGAEEGQVEMARIEAGQRSGGFVEVLSGLAAGDRVVAEGVNRVRPGAPVRIAPVAQAPVAGAAGPLEQGQ